LTVVNTTVVRTPVFDASSWSWVTVHAAEATDARLNSPAGHGRDGLVTAPEPVSLGASSYNKAGAVTMPVRLLSKPVSVAQGHTFPSGGATPVTEVGSLVVFGAVLIGAARIARRRFTSADGA
jgi:hypothetical protein